MVNGLKEMTVDEELNELADFELFQMEKSIEIYLFSVQINVKTIKVTQETSNLIPLTLNPAKSEKFLKAYQAEMEKPQKQSDLIEKGDVQSALWVSNRLKLWSNVQTAIRNTTVIVLKQVWKSKDCACIVEKSGFQK